MANNTENTERDITLTQCGSELSPKTAQMSTSASAMNGQHSLGHERSDDPKFGQGPHGEMKPTSLEHSSETLGTHDHPQMSEPKPAFSSKEDGASHVPPQKEAEVGTILPHVGH